MRHYVFDAALLSALCDVAYGANRLVDLALDGKPYGETLRDLILDLNRVEHESSGDIGQAAADLLGGEYNVEIRNGDEIWFSVQEEEEGEPCPAKT